MSIANGDVVLHLRRTWKGLEALASFFAVLERVQAEINDDRAFRLWCIDTLQISLDDIMRVSGVLAKSDAARVKKSFAQARRSNKRSKKKTLLLMYKTQNLVNDQSAQSS